MTTEPAEFLPLPLRRALPYFLLALATFIVYGNIFDNVFLFDDDLLITLNDNLHNWSSISAIFHGSTTSGAHIAGGFYRPVQMLLYLAITQIFGPEPFGFHLLNLVLHVANACLMFRLGIKLGFRPGGVFLASLLWAVHPLHVEAVTYMSATADPLFAFCSLLGIVYLIPEITPVKIWKTIPIFLFGLLSKETMVVFPLLVMVCQFLLASNRKDPRVYLRTWPLWIIALIFIWWRSTVPGLDGPQSYARFYNLPSYAILKQYSESPITRLYTFFATLPSYAQLLLWPKGLHMERSFPVFFEFAFQVFAGTVMCALTLFWVIRQTLIHGTGLALSWGLLWFFAAHAPDSGIIFPMNSIFLEHWMYLPAIGLFLGIAETIATSLKNRKVHMTLAAIVICFSLILAGKTWAQNMIWRDPDRFYNNIFAYGEISARARNNLGLYYSSIGQPMKAIEQLKKAISISDTYAETRHNLALTYLHLPNQQEHIQEAIDNLNRALEIDPNFYRSCETLSQIYAMQGDTEKATYYRERAAQILGNH